jgi:ParB family transcriptional regulator, chromosome partitioning protein
MAKSVDELYGAESRSSSTMLFDVEKLKIIKDKKHPLYDDRVEYPLNEELIASIMFGGVNVPIKVWKDSESGDVVVLDGKQRCANAHEANKRLKKDGQPTRQIPGIAFKGSLKAALAQMIILNKGRQDTTPQADARSAERLLEAGYSEPEVGTILHLKPGTLKNYLALLSCPAVVRAAVDKGDLQPTDAYKLSKLEPAEQKEKLATMLEAAKGVVGKRRRAKKMRAATGEKKMRSRKEVAAMLAVLVEKFGSAAQGTIDLLRWVMGEKAPDMERMSKKSKESTNGVAEAPNPT